MSSLEVTAHSLTAEEFFRMPESRTHELIDGELIAMVPVGVGHGDNAAEIVTQLRPFVKRHRLGMVGVEIGFILRRDPDVVRAPDIAFIEASRLPLPKQGFVDGPPTIAIEIVSPGDTRGEVEAKVGLYLECGTREVWIVDEEENCIQIRTPQGIARTFARHEFLESPLLPGFRMALEDVFGSWS